MDEKTNSNNIKNERIDTIGIACKESQAQVEIKNNNKFLN